MRAVGVVLLGLVAGFVTAMLQTFVVWLGDVPVPVGAGATLVVLFLLARAVGWWVNSRWGAVVFSVAWLAVTLVLASTTPGGDLVLSSGTRQIAYLVLGAMLLAGACGFPLLPSAEPGTEARAIDSPGGLDEL